MRIYPVIVFLHVLAAFVMLGGIGVEGVVLGGLERAASADEASDWSRLLGRNARAGGIAGLTLLVSGGWMMHQAWGPQGWLLASIAAIVLLGVGNGVSRRRLRPVLAAAASPALASSVPPPHPAVRGMLRFRIAVAIALVALMTLKPGPVEAWVIVAAAVVSGALAAKAPARNASPRRGKVTGGA